MARGDGSTIRYHPSAMVIDSILGHLRAKEQLLGAVRDGRLPQGILLVGPAHVGKSTLALAVAQALQCADFGCGTCAACRMVAHGSHPDIVVLADDGEGIAIETVRALTDRLSLTSQSPAKVAIIEDVSRMSLSAEGALLKTLEEPTPRTHFFLTASSLDDVLPTIRSRSTVVQMGLVAEDLLRPLVTQAGRGEDAETLLALADGRPGLLKSFLADDAVFTEEKERFAHALNLLGTAELLSRFRIVGEVSADAAEATAFLRMVLIALRQLLHEDPETVIPATRLVFNALSDLRTNARPRLILEDLVVHLPRFDRVGMRSAS